MYTEINKVIGLIEPKSISEKRKEELQVLIDFINLKKDRNEPIRLNFICTHNSRRSQFAQVWASVMANYYQIPIASFSGGVEVTACNSRTIQSLERFGFQITHSGGDNPKYEVKFADNAPVSTLYSKLYDDPDNPETGFAAIMTCSHADENCPVVHGCEKRISLRYDDPKYFDDSPLEAAMYDYRSYQIATEMMYIFSNVKK